MKWYHMTDPALRLEGLAHVSREKGEYWRLPEELIDAVNPGVASVARYPSGARVRFYSDTTQLTVRMTVEAPGYIKNVGSIGKCGLDVYQDGRWIFGVWPGASDATQAEATGQLTGGMHEYTLYLPAFAQIRDLEVGVEEGAQVKWPRDYALETPIVFYGSSITNGASASRPALAYPAIIARRLDANILNLGFSGSAKGEENMAEYIAGLDMSLFVLDYDYNAPSVEHLDKTHERFFRIIRSAQPELPVIMITRPGFEMNPEENGMRRQIVRRTWENAVKAGDRHVYFIDGETLLDPENPRDGLIDGVHPNDAGFRSMANVIAPVIQKALEEAK